jgi:dTDP-4-dehydrorhamnose reductase
MWWTQLLQLLILAVVYWCINNTAAMTAYKKTDEKREKWLLKNVVFPQAFTHVQNQMSCTTVYPSHN